MPFFLSCWLVGWLVGTLSLDGVRDYGRKGREGKGRELKVFGSFVTGLVRYRYNLWGKERKMRYVYIYIYPM